MDWILGLYYHHDVPEFNPLLVEGQATGSFPFLAIDSKQISDSYAIFGQATYDITDNTHLTAGVRFTRDERHLIGLRVAAPSTILADVDQQANFEKVTYRFSIDHQFTPELVYASYNRGFKSGTFNLSSLLDPPVQPEVLDAFELGFKAELFDRRLRFNAAAYYYDYSNIQTSQVVTGGQRIINAPGARIKGFDFDVTARPVDGLTLQAAFGYVHGRYRDFPDAPFFTPNSAGGATLSTINARGNETVHTPEITLTLAANYEWQTDIGQINLGGSYSYNDGFYWYPDNVTRQPSYSLISASLGWRSTNDRFGLTLWGRNLADEQYFSFVSEANLGFAGSPAAPRTYGMTFNVRY